MRSQEMWCSRTDVMLFLVGHDVPVSSANIYVEPDDFQQDHILPSRYITLDWTWSVQASRYLSLSY